MKAKQYDTEEQRQEREAKSDMQLDLVHNGLFNLYNKMDHSHSEAHNMYGNYGYDRTKFPEQSSFPT